MMFAMVQSVMYDELTGTTAIHTIGLLGCDLSYLAQTFFGVINC